MTIYGGCYEAMAQVMHDLVHSIEAYNEQHEAESGERLYPTPMRKVRMRITLVSLNGFIVKMLHIIPPRQGLASAFPRGKKLWRDWVVKS